MSADTLPEISLAHRDRWIIVDSNPAVPGSHCGHDEDLAHVTAEPFKRLVDRNRAQSVLDDLPVLPSGGTLWTR